MKLGDDTITLISRAVSGQDSYGNDIITPTETGVSGCRVYPRVSSAGSVEAGNQIVSGLWVLAPGGHTFRGADAVRHNGLDYEIDGEPGRFAAGGVSFQQFALRRVTG